MSMIAKDYIYFFYILEFPVEKKYIISIRENFFSILVSHTCCMIILKPQKSNCQMLYDKKMKEKIYIIFVFYFFLVSKKIYKLIMLIPKIRESNYQFVIFFFLFKNIFLYKDIPSVSMITPTTLNIIFNFNTFVNIIHKCFIFN